MFFFVAEFPQVEFELAARPGIQTGGGFIQQQYLRVVQQSFPQFHPPPLPARERFHQVAFPALQPDSLQHPLDALLQGFSGVAVEVSLVLEVFLHGQFAVHAGRLKDHSDLLAHGVRVFGDINTVYQRRAAAGEKQRCDNSEERRFSSAVRAQQSEEFSG